MDCLIPPPMTWWLVTGISTSARGPYVGIRRHTPGYSEQKYEGGHTALISIS